MTSLSEVFSARVLTALLLVAALAGCGGPELMPWHEEVLEEEFSTDKLGEINSLTAYLELEQRLFQEMDERIYAEQPAGPESQLNRYARGSLADPDSGEVNWNRSFVLAPADPVGGILLLHGMSDSPYSLRALAEEFRARDYTVVGLRMPGHGTLPSGLLHVTWQDMAAVTALGMHYLAQHSPANNLHIIGYSTGSALALDYALKVDAEPTLARPASLVLLSPAIGLSPAAALAKWSRRLSYLPGLGGLAWLGVDPEFDPYKYNSFTTNAAEQVHALTRSVAQRIASRGKNAAPLPPMLVAKSTVDATVSNDAVVDKLLLKVNPNRHEMLLFDINRVGTNNLLLRHDPGPFTRDMLDRADLPFYLTLVVNKDRNSRSIQTLHKAPNSGIAVAGPPLHARWPAGVFSLSHVAIPFPPDDPLYGAQRVDNKSLFLGTQSIQGERNVLRISADYLLRLRHNPFYDYLERRVLAWVEDPTSRAAAVSP